MHLTDIVGCFRLLRADIHTLFDLELPGIDPDTMAVELHPNIRSDPSYSALQSLRLRFEASALPSLDALQIRFDQFRRNQP